MSIDISNLIAYSIYSIIVLLLTISFVRYRLYYKRQLAMSMQLALDKLTLLNELDKLSEGKDAKGIEETEGFLRFISESRDWAFEYIENVQNAINAYDEALSSKNANAMQETYANLIAMLPKEDASK
jgi:hypothetical protein